jgi:hypothetical protein
MSYFEELQHDWNTLGFDHNQVLNRYRPTRKVEPREVETYDDLHHLMINLTLNVAAAHDEWSRYRTRATGDNLSTELGKRILFLCTQPGFIRGVDRWMCPDSEPNITAVFNTENIRNENFPSPVIITRNDVAVGAIKRLGERSYYALRDDAQTDTYAGQVYRTPLTNWEMPFANPSKYPHALRMDIDEVHYLTGNTRLTFFTVPVEAREDIRIPKYLQTLRHSLSSSHEELTTAIDEALPDAIPTALGRRVMETVW